MGPSRKFSKTRIPEKSGKVTCLAIRKAFKNTHVFQRRPLDCTQIKIICHSNNQNTIRIFLFLVVDSYGWCCSLIHMIDMFCKVTQIKSFSSSSFSCLPMKVYESEYMLNILFSLGTCIAHALFGAIWVLICLYSPNPSKIFQKISKTTSYTWNQAIKRFQVT